LQVENETIMENIHAVKLAEAHTMYHDELGLNLVSMEYVSHSIPLSPHQRKKGKQGSK